MAIIVALNPVTSTPTYYDSLSGVSLTRANPQSGDLSSLSAPQFAHIVAAVNEGILVLVSGVLPSVTTGGASPVSLVGANFDTYGNLLVSTANSPASGSGSGSSAGIGTYLSTQPTLSNAQTTTTLVDNRGNALVNLNAGFGSSLSNPLYVSGSFAATATGVSTVSYVYKSSPPTLTNNGTTSPLVDSLGNALVNLNAGVGTTFSNPLYVSTTNASSGSTSVTATYKSSPPTLANNATTPLLVDSSGYQYVNLVAGLGSSIGNPLYVSNSSASTASGTATYKSAPPVLANNATTPILVDSVGNQVVNINGGFGSTFANPLYVSTTNAASGTTSVTGTYKSSAPALSNNSTTPLLVDSSGNLLFNLVAGYGTTSGNPLYVSGSFSSTTSATYKSSPPTLTNNATTPILADQLGNQTVSITDSIAGYHATVAQFHATDNQNPGATGYGLLTGGIAQILNASGNLDRQRETGSDNISAIGIATGTAQLASPFTVTLSSITASASAQAVTPSAMSGTNRGAAWSIQVGTVLTVDSGTSQEKVSVTSVGTTTFNAVFTKSHSAGASAIGRSYNEARDATIPDGSLGSGLSAGATYLLNTTLNSGNGGWEGERSAAGELDGASGTGTAVAVEYEYNGLTYDRGRTIQGKGLTSGALTTATQGTATLTFTSTPTGLQAGQAIFLAQSATNLQTGGATEMVYVSTSYTSGSTTVPLTSNIINSGHTIGLWDINATLGPGLNGLTGAGIGIEEDVVYDPVTGLFFLERSATQDTASGQNLPLEAIGGYNGSTFDRLRTVPGAVAQGNNTGVLAAGLVSTNGTAVTVTSSSTDGNASSYQSLLVISQNEAFNGTTYDRIRKAPYTSGPVYHTDAGSSSTTLVNTGGAIVVKNSPGQLCRVNVVSAGSNSTPIVFYDSITGSGGTPLGALPTNCPIGSFSFMFPALVGISYTTVSGGPTGGISFF